MAGTIEHSWNGTVLTIKSDSGISSADLKGEKGDTGIRGAQGAPGIVSGADLTGYATEQYVNDAIANIEIPSGKSIVSYSSPLEVPLESGSQYILYGSNAGTITVTIGGSPSATADYQLANVGDVVWLLWMQTAPTQGSIITTSGTRKVMELSADFSKMKISSTIPYWIVIKID